MIEDDRRADLTQVVVALIPLLDDFGRAHALREIRGSHTHPTPAQRFTALTVAAHDLDALAYDVDRAETLGDESR